MALAELARGVGDLRREPINSADGSSTCLHGLVLQAVHQEGETPCRNRKGDRLTSSGKLRASPSDVYRG